jgi:hypothetical protein
MKYYIFIDLTKDEEEQQQPKRKRIKIKTEAENEENLKQSRRKYYLKNREKIKARNKERYEITKSIKKLNKMTI